MTVFKQLSKAQKLARVAAVQAPRAYSPASFVEKITPVPGFPTNILKFDKFAATVDVEVPWSDDYYPEDPSIGKDADAIELVWDNQILASTRYEIRAADQTAKIPLILKLPLTTDDNWDAIPHSLGYRIDWGDSTAYDFGDTQPAYVDTTPPGRPAIGKLIFPGLTPGPGGDYVITLAELDPSTKDLIAHAPSYSGEAPGDLLEAFITSNGGQPVFLTTTTRIPPGNPLPNPVVLRFPFTDLDAAGDGTHTLGFRVTDLAGNVSAISQETAVRFVLHNTPINLSAPDIPLFADDGIIDEADARILDIEIPTYVNVALNDEFLVFLGSKAIGGGKVLDVNDDPLAVVRVPYADVLAGDPAGANATRYTTQATYQVIRSQANVGTSPPRLNVLVDVTGPAGPDPDPDTPENENLALPSLLSTGSGATANVITAAHFPLDATVTIPWPSVGDLLAGDLVTASYAGVDIAPAARPVEASEVTNKVLLPFTLPAAQIGAAGAGAIPLKYAVERTIAASSPYPAVTNTSYSGVQTVQVTSPGSTPGGGGPLPVGAFQGLNASGFLDICNTANGAVFRIPLTYTNAAEGDRIVLTGRGYVGRPQSGGAALPNTDFTATDSVNSDEFAQKYIDFRIPASAFGPTLYPGRYNHLQVHHEITNASGTGATNPPSITQVTMVGSVCNFDTTDDQSFSTSVKPA
ncbi:hypothetical protein [Pseudomonas sp. PS01301]|uniref:hypothetical protein n=1 Tax=Pseudomonas sp. PS01301 TaxID=2991437 RepID=UPI00249C4D95|nr:hypothetical protein [Pseudomonas sp. PS01301]